MKKKILLVGLLVSMGISACGNAQTEVSTDSTVQEEETTVEETVVNEESTEDVLVERVSIPVSFTP